MSLDNPSSQRFSDERGSATQTGNKYLGNELDHIINEEGSDHQFDWFVPDKAEGLTQAGLSRINQSIEAFVYCVLGAQVNVRSSILGDGGRAKEAQTEFLVLLEESIRQPNLSKSVQRYQLAVDEAKVRLNLAVAPGTWFFFFNFFLNKYFIIFSKVQTFYSILYLYKFIRRFTDIKYSFLLRDLGRLQDINA